MNNTITLAYFTGLAVGSFVTWVVIRNRISNNAPLERLAWDSCSQAAFIAATSDVVDDDTCIEIKKRANARLDEYDIPGNPKWHFDSSKD